MHITNTALLYFYFAASLQNDVLYHFFLKLNNKNTNFENGFYQTKITNKVTTHGLTNYIF